MRTNLVHILQKRFRVKPGMTMESRRMTYGFYLLGLIVHVQDCRAPVAGTFDEKGRMLVARTNRICIFAITYFTDKSGFA